MCLCDEGRGDLMNWSQSVFATRPNSRNQGFEAISPVPYLFWSQISNNQGLLQSLTPMVSRQLWCDTTSWRLEQLWVVCLSKMIPWKVSFLLDSIVSSLTAHFRNLCPCSLLQNPPNYASRSMHSNYAYPTAQCNDMHHGQNYNQTWQQPLQPVCGMPLNFISNRVSTNFLELYVVCLRSALLVHPNFSQTTSKFPSQCLRNARTV